MDAAAFLRRGNGAAAEAAFCTPDMAHEWLNRQRRAFDESLGQGRYLSRRPPVGSGTVSLRDLLWLCKAAHALAGEGARFSGGRWNLVERPTVYTEAVLSLAVLEALIHLDLPFQISAIICAV
ncbi:RES domain-containing protein [Sphingobium yanoikuyae]|uniref:RES domain-containing protein n=2 Tax=Sphingobium TaxID=165695 RepID=UPI0022DD45A2|nr:RES domain-containing protein [Sphingobium yanoikuyae]WBQ19471.1 hypothetical protein PAE53_24515 [Sphingobium yanoikuyae]